MALPPPRVLALAGAATLAGVAAMARIPPATEPADGAAGTRVSFSALDEAGSPIDLAGCRVHLLPAERLGPGRVHPCGTWIDRPAEAHRYYLEGPGFVSPATWWLAPRDGFDVPWRYDRPVVPAGTIALSSENPLRRREVLYLLHLSSHGWGETLERELVRTVDGGDARRGVAMPEGKVLSAIFDVPRQAFTALARPVWVYEGLWTWVHPQPPAAGTSDLVVFLERPRSRERPPEVAIEVRLLEPRGERQPDVLVAARERLIAVWYALRGATATVTARSPEARLAPRSLALRPNAVTSHRVILDRGGK